MSVKSKYSVESIQKHETYDWLLFKHYAKRLTNIKYSFGLFDEKKYCLLYTSPSPRDS